MAKSTDLIVNIITDASKAGDGIDQATGKFGKFNSVMGGLVGPASAVLGGITLLGTTAVDAASDLEQAAGATESVFGSSADQIKAWASAASESVGLSSAKYQTMAATLGASLKNMGVPMDQVAGKTDEMIRLGADLAATYGGTTEEAVSALGSAMRGEADPAERYGLALSQTAIGAEMAAAGTDQLEGSALTAAKAQAILDKATQDAGGAIGAAAREHDTLASSQQRLGAQIDDTAAAFGTALLPVIAPVVAALGDFAKFLGENTAIIGPLVAIIGVLAAAVLVYAAAQWIANSAMLANPVFWIIGGILLLVAALVAAAIWVSNNTEAIAQFFGDLWQSIQDVVGGVVSWFRAVWGAVAGWFQSIWAAVGAFFKGIWNSFVAVVGNVINGIRAVVGTVASWFQSVWNSAINAVSAIIRTLQGIFASVFNAIMGPINAVIGAFNRIVSAVKDVINWIGKIKIPDIGGMLGGLFSVGAQSATFAGGSALVSGSALAAGSLGSVPAASGVAAGTVINVYGGLDSGDTIARRIDQLLRERERRTGGVQLVRRRG